MLESLSSVIVWYCAKEECGTTKMKQSFERANEPIN